MSRRLFAFYIFLSSLVHAQPQWQAAQALSELNSTADDFAPCWNSVSHGMLFSSTRQKGTRMYQCDSTFRSAELAHNFSASNNVSRGFCSFSNDGSFVCSQQRHGDRAMVPNIVMAQLSNGIWSEPEFIQSLASPSFSSQPSISPDGSLLVFVSDREGGEGGTDLWMSTRSGPLWSPPINMGEVINSAGDEITPFLASSDTLYFASNGVGGRGGFDLFMSVRVAGEWQPPLPLNSINTAYDESDLIILANRSAIFASNRVGTKGGLDLFLAPAQK